MQLGNRKRNITLTCISLLIAAAMIACLFTGSAVANDENTAPQDEEKNILMIHSYYSAYEWTVLLTNGLLDTFAKSNYSDAEIYFEYMDAKRHPEEIYLDSISEVYKQKYKDKTEFDLIICSDNYAVDLVCSEKGVEIFGNDTPIVFVGTNEYDATWKEYQPMITGVLENTEPETTMDLILDIYPETEMVYIAIEENTLTSKLVTKDIERSLEPYSEKVELKYSGNISIKELKTEVSQLPDNSAIIVALFNRDKNGEELTISGSTHIIAENTDRPMFALWSLSLGEGVIGGKLLEPYNEGRIAAELGIKILDGQSANDIPIIDQPHNQYMFDWKVMEKFSITEDNVPEGSFIINKETSFSQENPRLAIGIIAFLIIQFLLVSTLIIKKKRLQRSKQMLMIAREKAEESDRLKSSFLANMSHEIRTPMNAILGFSELLKNTEIPVEKRKRYIDLIHSSGQNLVLIINDILDISQIESGRMEIFKKDFQINGTLDELHSVFLHRIETEGKNIELILNKDVNDESYLLYSDEGRIRQILLNLLGNSLKFTDEGIIEFGYNVKKDLFEFYVKDTGIGMPQNDLMTIFYRFQQIEGDHSRKYKGTGLGLAISKSLVELMGGNIRVKSEEGKGTTFYFTIPLK